MVIDNGDMMSQLARELRRVVGDRAQIAVNRNSKAGLREISIDLHNERAAPMWMAVDQDSVTVRIGAGSRMDIAPERLDHRVPNGPTGRTCGGS
jgi:hypothetical protein